MAKEDRKIMGGSMVAPHPPADGKLHPVEAFVVSRNITASEFAGLCRAKRWAPGKQVSEAEFDQALEAFRSRPMGGGKI